MLYLEDPAQIYLSFLNDSKRVASHRRLRTTGSFTPKGIAEVRLNSKKI